MWELMRKLGNICYHKWGNAEMRNFDTQGVQVMWVAKKSGNKEMRKWELIRKSGNTRIVIILKLGRWHDVDGRPAVTLLFRDGCWPMKKDSATNQILRWGGGPTNNKTSSSNLATDLWSRYVTKYDNSEYKHYESIFHCLHRLEVFNVNDLISSSKFPLFIL